MSVPYQLGDFVVLHQHGWPESRGGIVADVGERQIIPTGQTEVLLTIYILDYRPPTRLNFGLPADDYKILPEKRKILPYRVVPSWVRFPDGPELAKWAADFVFLRATVVDNLHPS